MAKCKLCNTNIPEGIEYCHDCQDKENAKTNESYLDSLLNSVKNTAPATEQIYKKKNDTPVQASDKGTEPAFIEEPSDEDMFRFDFDDIEDFDQFNIDEDLKDLSGEEFVSDEDLFGEAIVSEPKKAEYQITETVVPSEEIDHAILSEIEEPSEEMDDTILSEIEEPLEEIDDTTKPMMEEPQDFDDDISANIMQALNEENEEDPVEDDLELLLNQLDSDQDGVEDSYDVAEEAGDPKEEAVYHDLDPFTNVIDENELEEILPEEEDDFLSLLNQISSDDPVADDVKAITELMKGGPVAESNINNMPTDVGEVFSDALKAVSNLNDPTWNEEELLGGVPDKKEKKKKEKKSRVKKEKTNNKEKVNKKNAETGEESEEIPKKGMLKRVFGNVEDKPDSKKGSKKASGAEIIDILDAPKKSKRRKKAKDGEEEETSDTDRRRRDTADTEEAEDTKAKKKKKEKKVKSSDVIMVIDEIDEDVGRINRLGATIVFVFFGLLALLIYVGTNAVSYTLSIEHATTYFDKRKYTQAYEEVYGMEVEDDDVEIYSKIMTVMFVNKQLNSYNNYVALGENPKALDSLLKGLKRYDKYITLASLLGIKTDMDYVREQILAELDKKFKISESEAIKINKIEDTKEYSVKVYDIALEME